jgi:hypothetical protein
MMLPAFCFKAGRPAVTLSKRCCKVHARMNLTVLKNLTRAQLVRHNAQHTVCKEHARECNTSLAPGGSRWPHACVTGLNLSKRA